MSMKLKIFLSALLAVAPLTAADAPVSLDALVTDAVARNSELAFYAAEIDAARAGLRGAGLRAEPELTVSAGRKRVTDPAGMLVGEGTAWSVSLAQTFEWPGRIALRKSIANRQLDLAELGLARFQAALRVRARTLAYGLFAAQEKAAAAAEVATRYAALRELFLQRDPAGLTPLLETRVIEARELALQRRAATAALAAQAALTELNQLRGAPPDAALTPAAARLIFNPAPELSVLLAAARDHNFEFRAARLELETQGLAVSLARHERRPSVTLAPFFSQENAGDRETTFGLGLTVPLPVTGRAGPRTALAEARRRQAEAASLVAQRQMERDVFAAAQTFAVKLAEVGRWSPDAAAKFREAAELADRHYRLGAVPLATYVELQHSYLDAVEALYDTQLETLAAGQQLELLTGLSFRAAELAP
jgi:cobalt-zinc-cadmium efflux system outer membrane protein